MLPAVQADRRAVLAARDGEEVLGSVQLHWGTPPNQPHRADVTKLIVHPDTRRRGIARALMEHLHDLARDKRRSLITLDTVTQGAAKPLYEALGDHHPDARGVRRAVEDGVRVMAGPPDPW